MNQELIKQAMAMFDSPEKWNAFLELASAKDKIRTQWFSKLREEADSKFSRKEVVENWGFRSWVPFGMAWYQKKHEEKSIQLQLSWNLEMKLYCNRECYNIDEIHKLLKTEKFTPLLNCFNRIDSCFNQENLVTEIRNFSFNSPYDTKLDIDQLGWYAGNKTEDFLNQIAEKVDKYRKDEAINLLLDQLNEQTKI